MNLRQIMRAKPPTAAPDESAASAWQRMLAVRSDHLVVVNEGEIVGVLSRLDLGGPSGGARRRMGRRVADLMKRDVATASPTTDVKRAAALMRRQGIGCLPVVERGRLVGLVAVSDMLALLERTLESGGKRTKASSMTK